LRNAQANAAAQPDLAGYWTHATATNLERDPKFGDRLVMTQQEAAEAEDEMVIGDEHRTSFVVSPPTASCPSLTPAAKAARADRIAQLPLGIGYARGDHPEGMTLAERCLRDYGSLLGPPMMPVGYDDDYQIIQTPDYVVILVEMIHDVRIIPLAGEHRPDVIRPWMGDSLGHYEGDTLVIETTNFRPDLAFRGALDHAPDRTLPSHQRHAARLCVRDQRADNFRGADPRRGRLQRHAWTSTTNTPATRGTIRSPTS